MEDERTLWGMYESTDGWLCVSNMADRAAGMKENAQVMQQMITDNNESLSWFLTSGCPRVWVPSALAHAGEELVDLF